MSDRHTFEFVQDAYGRWAACSCGWIGPDVVGIDGAQITWRQHVERQVTTASAQPPAVLGVPRPKEDT